MLLLTLLVGSVGQPAGLFSCQHSSLEVTRDEAQSIDPCVEGVAGTPQMVSAGVHCHCQAMLPPSLSGQSTIAPIGALPIDRSSIPYTLRTAPPSPPPRV